MDASSATSENVASSAALHADAGTPKPSRRAHRRPRRGSRARRGTAARRTACALAGRCEQEEELLLGDRLPRVEDVGRRVLDPAVAVSLEPGDGARAGGTRGCPSCSAGRSAPGRARSRAARPTSAEEQDGQPARRELAERFPRRRRAEARDARAAARRRPSPPASTAPTSPTPPRVTACDGERTSVVPDHLGHEREIGDEERRDEAREPRTHGIEKRRHGRQQHEERPDHGAECLMSQSPLLNPSDPRLIPLRPPRSARVGMLAVAGGD